MLGLTPSSNVINNGQQNKRSHKFAEKLSGRFFVAGVSGSFQKHRKQQLGIEDSNDIIPRPEKYAYQPVLEKRQKELLQNEALALIEMEEKLSEMKRVKEGRKRRMEQRSIGKLKYKSAETIRRAFKRFMVRKYSGAMYIILDFMRSMAHKQALSTAVWAIGVIRKFSWKATFYWKKKQARLRAIRECALMNWDFVAEIACVWTQARRTVADECVFNALKLATQSAKTYILATDGWVAPVAVPKSSGHKTRSFGQNNNGVKKPSFFLTGDMENPEGNNEEEDDESVSVVEKLQRFQAAQNRFSNALKANNIQKNILLSVRDVVSATSVAHEMVKKKKIYDDKNEQVKRLMELHKQKMREMDVERERRVKLLEQSKLIVPPPEPERKKSVNVKPTQHHHNHHITSTTSTSNLNTKPAVSSSSSMQHSQSAQNVVSTAAVPFAVRKMGHVSSNGNGNKEGEETKETTSHKHSVSSKSNQPTTRQSRSKTQSVDDSHIHTTTNKDINSGEIYLDQHLGALPSSAPHTSSTNNNNNQNNGNNTTRRTTSSSKVVNKIMNAMATAASTADRDKLVRDNNHMHSGEPPPAVSATEGSSSRRLGVVTEGVPIKQTVVYHMYSKPPAPVEEPVVLMKRPAVPSQAGAVSAMKSKAEKEAEDLREQLLIEQQARYQKYNSDEALKKSRLAMQRRVAMKAQRVLEKQKEEENEEVARKEKLEQVALDARKKLLLAKVRFAEKNKADKDKKAGNNKGASENGAEKGKKKKKVRAGDVKEITAHPREINGDHSDDDDDEGNGNLQPIYQDDEGEEQERNEGEEDEEEDEEGSEGGGIFDVNALLNQEEEEEEFNDEDEDNDDEEDNNNNTNDIETDSLELDMAFLPQTQSDDLRGSSGAGGLLSGRVLMDSAQSRRAKQLNTSSRDENDPLQKPAELTRVDTQLVTPQIHVVNSRVKFAPETPKENSAVEQKAVEPPDSPSYFREVHHISSAKEDYSDLIEDFEVEQFFSDGGGFQPLFTSFQELEGISAAHIQHPSHTQPLPHPASSDTNTTSGVNIARRAPASSVTNSNNKGPAKPPVAIPKHLQNTPYFVDYKKHANGTLVTAGNGGGGGGGSIKVKKQPPSVKQKTSHHQLHDDDDESVESHPPNKKSLGRVASLMEMVDRARQKQSDAQTLSSQSQYLAVPLDSPPKPPYLLNQQQHEQHSQIENANGSGSSYAYTSIANNVHKPHVPPVHPISIPTHTSQQGPLSAYGNTPTAGAAAPIMSFKKFQAMSPSIPLPPIAAAGGLLFKSNKVTGAVTVVEKKNTNNANQSTQQQQQQPRHNRVQKGKALSSTATSNSSTEAPSTKKKKKAVKKHHRVAPRGGPIFDHTPLSDSDHSDEDDEEEQRLQQEYDAKRSAFAKRLADSVNASVNASYNNSTNNTAPTSPKGEPLRGGEGDATPHNLSRSITQLYSEQREGSHEVTTRDLLDAWSIEEQEETNGTEYGNQVLFDEVSGEIESDLHHEEEVEGHEEDPSNEEEKEEEKEQQQEELNMDDDMCNLLMQNLAFKING